MQLLDAHDLAEGLETFPDRRYASLHCFIDNLHAGLRAELEELGELGDMTMLLTTGKYRLFHDEPSGIVRFVRDDLSTTPSPIKGEPGVAETSRRSRGDLVAAILVRSDNPADRAFRCTFPLQWSHVEQKWVVYNGPLLRWLKTTLVPLDDKNGDDADDNSDRHPCGARAGDAGTGSRATRSSGEAALDGQHDLQRADGEAVVSESTLAIIKPDAVLGGHVADIVKAIEATGPVLDPTGPKVGLVVRWAITAQLHSAWWGMFYEEHQGRPFFPELIGFMSSGPCVFMRLEGPNAIKRWRELMGATDPQKADPSSIRGRYGDSGPRNAVHGSDSPESANRELCLVVDEIAFWRRSCFQLSWKHIAELETRLGKVEEILRECVPPHQASADDTLEAIRDILKDTPDTIRRRWSL